MSDATFFFGGWEPIVRILVVGTGAYAALVLLLRVTKKRTLAQLNAFDFIITVAIGASFGRILTARDVALAEAVTTFALLVVLQLAVTRLQMLSPAFAKAVTAPPSMLFFRGRFLRDVMRRERVTEGELRSVVRTQGIGSWESVEAIVLEANGRFAVIQKDTAGDGSALADLDEAHRGG